jgi:serine protease Do
VPPGYQREVTGLGSGFIIRADGLVVTNEHVVRGAAQVVVTLPDGREFDAEVVGTDEVNDLAVLRLRCPAAPRSLPVAPLGDSDDLMIGEWVVAIGNPLGFLLSNTEPTVTAGVVSATGRNIMPGEGRAARLLPGHDPDRRLHQPGQLRRPAGERAGRGDRRELVHPLQQRRQRGARLRDPHRPGAADRAGPAGGRPLRPRLDRRGGGGGRDRRAAARIRDVRIARWCRARPRRARGCARGWWCAPSAAAGPHPLDWEAGVLQRRVGEALEVRVDEGGRERSVRLVPADLPSLGAERIQALRDFQLVTLTPPSAPSAACAASRAR